MKKIKSLLISLISGITFGVVYTVSSYIGHHEIGYQGIVGGVIFFLISFFILLRRI